MLIKFPSRHPRALWPCRPVLRGPSGDSRPSVPLRSHVPPFSSHHLSVSFPPFISLQSPPRLKAVSALTPVIMLHRLGQAAAMAENDIAPAPVRPGASASPPPRGNCLPPSPISSPPAGPLRRPVLILVKRSGRHKELAHRLTMMRPLLRSLLSTLFSLVYLHPFFHMLFLSVYCGASRGSRSPSCDRSHHAGTRRHRAPSCPSRDSTRLPSSSITRTFHDSRRRLFAAIPSLSLCAEAFR